MRFPVDLSLLDEGAHNPGLPRLQRSMGRTDLQLRDFSIPVNPYFPTRAMWDRIHGRLECALKYYPSTNAAIAERLADVLGLDPQTAVVANGSTELITWINQLWVRGGLVTDVPTFGRWTDNPAELEQPLHAYRRRREDDFRLDVDRFVRFANRTGASCAAICNPNNPTGAFLQAGEVARLLDGLRGLDVVVVDESFSDFADPARVPTAAREAAQRDNAIVIKSLGKNFGLHGVRAGYAVANPRLAARLRDALPPWNASALAELLIDELPHHLAEYEISRRRVIRDTRLLAARLSALGPLRVFPTAANFVCVELPCGVDGVALRNALLTEHGYLIRECGNKQGASSRYLRIAARPVAEQDEFLAALQATLRQLHRAAA